MVTFSLIEPYPSLAFLHLFFLQGHSKRVGVSIETQTDEDMSVIDHYQRGVYLFACKHNKLITASI